ncbi:MAG: glycosyltransferase [Polaromonas sp.]|nr:glycosyltransferase [Polaromonas sp.]
MKPIFRNPPAPGRAAAGKGAAQAQVNKGLALQQKGQMAQARDCYLQALKLQPAHFDALHLLGVLSYLTGDAAQAVEWIGKAIAVHAGNAMAFNNRSAAWRSLGQFAAALADCDRAVELKPDYAEAWNNRGAALRGLQQAEAALASYDRAIALNPDYADAWNNRGNALVDQQQPEAAIASYDQALRARPDYAEAWYNRGNALRSLKQHQAAVDSYDRAIALRPTHAPAFNNRGNALGDLERHQEALDSYDRALALRPDHPETLKNRGVALGHLGQYPAALESYDRAISLRPDDPETWSNRGVVLAELDRLPEAIASYDQAIRCRPAYAEAYNNRGAALGQLRQYQAAAESYERAVALRPDYAEAWNNRGVARGNLREYPLAMESYDQAIALRPAYADAWRNRSFTLGHMGQPRQAIEGYTHAITLEPEHAGAHLHRSLLLLLLGDFDEGWKQYEWRWKDDSVKAAVRHFSQPMWTGAEPLQGKTILLHAEQGLGDTLQFCRYARRVRALGARVILEVQPALAGLLAGVDGADQVLAGGQPLPAFDFYCPLLSLPLAFGTRLDSIPSAGSAYLSAPADRLAHWQARLGEKTRPRVGLVWSGNAAHTNDQNRSFPLAGLVDRLPPGVDFISLQKEIRPADQETLAQHPQILRLDEEIRDFSDTAALCALVDVVLSVDTSVAHLAGALGRPVWIALPFNPDWRWLLDRRDSPWYPSATLYRQSSPGRWDDVMTRLGRDLARLAPPHPAGG